MIAGNILIEIFNVFGKCVFDATRARPFSISSCNKDFTHGGSVLASEAPFARLTRRIRGAHHRAMRHLIVLVLTCLGTAACAGPAATPARPDPNDTLARVRALVGGAGCTDDSQCHSLALGARPCGGPEGYLPWSSKATSPDEVQALGALYKAEREQANRASGRVGDCRFQPDPGAVCRGGTCQSAGQGGGQAPLR